MTEQHIAICEALDWRVHDDPEEDYVELVEDAEAIRDMLNELAVALTVAAAKEGATS